MSANITFAPSLSMTSAVDIKVKEVVITSSPLFLVPLMKLVKSFPLEVVIQYLDPVYLESFFLIMLPVF